MTAADPAGDARVVLAGGCDTNGMLRAKRLPASRFAGGAVPHLAFTSGIFGFDYDEELQQPPEGFAHWFPSWADGYGDIVGVPDMATLRRVPWLEHTALVLCDFADDAGRPIRISPRDVLRRVAAGYGDLGLEPWIACEYEFTLLRETEESLVAKKYRDPVFLGQMAQGYGTLRAVMDGVFGDRLRELVDAFGVPIEGWLPEAGFGQYELNIPPADPLTAADRGFLFKHAVKEVATQNGLVATFMPRLATSPYGNGLHINQSLRTADGRSATADRDAPHRLAAPFRRFIAGQLATLGEFTVLLAPTVNDYKRLTPLSAAGTTVSWGHDNKSVALRVVTGADEAAWRAEHRTPGATANPYLAIAALLAGGLHGIENELDLPAPQSGNVYLSQEVEALPAALPDAVSRWERSAVARRYFGDDFVDYYAATRRHEHQCFMQAVTDWELRRYLLKG